MDDRSKELLAGILEKRITNLTEEEKQFIKARKSYLNDRQLIDYKDILEPKSENQTSKKETVNKNAKPQKAN